MTVKDRELLEIIVSSLFVFCGDVVNKIKAYLSQKVENLTCNEAVLRSIRGVGSKLKEHILWASR